MNVVLKTSCGALWMLTIAMAGLLLSTSLAWAESPATLAAVEATEEPHDNREVAPALRMGAQALAGTATLALAMGGGVLIHESLFFAGFFVGLPLAIYGTGHLLGGDGHFIGTVAGTLIGMFIVGAPVLYALFEMNGEEWLLALPLLGAVAGGVAGYWYSSPPEHQRAQPRGPQLYMNPSLADDDNRLVLGIRGSF